MLFQVYLDFFLCCEPSVAHWTTCIVQKPVVYAMRMEDVETAKHSASWFILDWFNTYNTFLNEIFSILHADQCFFKFLVWFGWKILVDGILCASYAFTIFRFGSVMTVVSSISISVSVYSWAVWYRWWFEWWLAGTTFCVYQVVLFTSKSSLLFKFLPLSLSTHKKIKLIRLLSFKFSKPFSP